MLCYYLTHCLGNKKVYSFSYSIFEVNLVTRLEFELAYINALVQQVFHYAMDPV